MQAPTPHTPISLTVEPPAFKMSDYVSMSDADAAVPIDYDALAASMFNSAATQAHSSNAAAQDAPQPPTAVLDTQIKVTFLTEFLHSVMRHDLTEQAPLPDVAQLRAFVQALLPEVHDQQPHYDVAVDCNAKLGPGLHVTVACVNRDLRTAHADFNNFIGNQAMWDVFGDQNVTHWRQVFHPRPKNNQQFPAPTCCWVKLRIPTKHTSIKAATLASEIEEYLYNTTIVDLTTGGLLLDAHRLVYYEQGKNLVVTVRPPPKLPNGTFLPFFEITIGIYCQTLSNPTLSTLHGILACAIPPPLVPYISSNSLLPLALNQLVASTSDPSISSMLTTLTCFNTGCIGEQCACYERVIIVRNDIPTLFNNPQQLTNSPLLSQTERLEAETLLTATGQGFVVSSHLGMHVSTQALPSPFLAFFLTDPSQIEALQPLIERLAQDPHRHYIFANIDLTASKLQDTLCLYCASPLHPYHHCHSNRPIIMATGTGICPTMCTEDGCPITGKRCTHKHPLGHYDPVRKAIVYSYTGPLGRRTLRTDLAALDQAPRIPNGPVPKPSAHIPLDGPPSTHVLANILSIFSHSASKVIKTATTPATPPRPKGHLIPSDVATSVATLVHSAALGAFPHDESTEPPTGPLTVLLKLSAPRTLLAILSLDPTGSTDTTLNTISDAEAASPTSAQLQHQPLLDAIANMAKTPASAKTLNLLHTRTGLRHPSHADWFSEDQPRPEAILATALARGFGVEFITVTPSPDSSRLLTQAHLVGDPATVPYLRLLHIRAGLQGATQTRLMPWGDIFITQPKKLQHALSSRVRTPPPPRPPTLPRPPHLARTPHHDNTTPHRPALHRSPTPIAPTWRKPWPQLRANAVPTRRMGRNPTTNAKPRKMPTITRPNVLDPSRQGALATDPYPRTAHRTQALLGPLQLHAPHPTAQPPPQI